jgi:guanosine-3',5'-bis(diphosphate) 3'-pyrophosphohydrolase
MNDASSSLNDALYRLLHAAEFASLRHKDQRRKDAAASPYINHPLAVAAVLARHGVRDPITLMAAVLHDTIEDTETTEADLRAEFGDDVTEVVLEVTDDKSLPKRRRKELQVEHAPTMTARAKLVKISDKICNVIDIGQNPPSGWDRERREQYLAWTEAVVAGCRGVSPQLEDRYDEVVRAQRGRIAEDD